MSVYKYDLTNPFDGSPHGWVQWKGTDVCMDVHCECGEMTHVDGEFCYFVQCGACSRRYEVQGFVRLMPVDAGAKIPGPGPLVTSV